jgi:CBS domain-containing protein
MAISLLDQELDQFGPLKNLRVKEMVPGLLSRIHAVVDTSMAETAFKKMVELNVSGLPVLNEQGELVDTISVRDLRGIGPPPGTNNFDLLFQPISSFKSKCRQIFKTQTPETPIFVTENDTFEKLMHSFYDGNIHRVFVCDLNDNNKPIPRRIISQRDVLRFIIWRIGMAPALIPTSAI